MAISNYEIEQALVKAYLDLTLGYPTEYPNHTLAEKPDDLWVALDNMRGETQPTTLGEAGEDLHSGIFQISLNTAIGKGTAIIHRALDEIANHFPAGTRLVFGNSTVVIMSATLDDGRAVEGYWRVSLSLSYECRQPRI
ncbi:tail-completion protein [Vibrio phage 2.117.O._10N.261.45.E9]|nr:tail-completion protein [Vibrio phage 1.117.O._10N.261.45.E9]AUR95437.1 tail-completion protein [Vibrio phage 1.207.B._10N.222.51.C2]AUS02328.1 tail-completion protein [Vibrio phage 2.117.O._10N.261.45.E9]